VSIKALYTPPAESSLVPAKHNRKVGELYGNTRYNQYVMPCIAPLVSIVPSLAKLSPNISPIHLICLT